MGCWVCNMTQMHGCTALIRSRIVLETGFALLGIICGLKRACTWHFVLHHSIALAFCLLCLPYYIPFKDSIGIYDLFHPNVCQLIELSA